MRKRVEIWWEHAEVTAGKGKVVSRFPRLYVCVLRFISHAGFCNELSVLFCCVLMWCIISWLIVD